jgi:hypothetical protein
MKNYLQLCRFVFIVMAVLIVSCQKDGSIIENPPIEDSIEAGSVIATLIQRAAIEDRSFDDFIDLADCLSINLPLTITVNDISITINDENDYNDVLALLANFNNKYDLEIVFPIVITLNDYTQIVINAEEELIPYVIACQEQGEDIPCIKFVFPISFSIYNIAFELIDTLVINSNEELYLFIENIQAGTLVSLNYPVLMELQNGEIIEANNNIELQEAIEAAALDCDIVEQTDFTCFNKLDYVLEVCIDAYSEAAFFDLSSIISSCDTDNEFTISYHYTEQDAITNQNAIPNPEEYTLASPFKDNTIYILVSATSNPGDFIIYELILIVFNCNDEICNEESLNIYLSECKWATNGSIPFVLDFNNGQITATLNENEQTGQYTTGTQIIISSGQEFTQYTINGFTGDFVVLNTTYEVGFCSEEYIAVHSINPEDSIAFTGMERDCDTGCDNPGIITNDLIIYIPFGEEAVELISGEQLNDEAITYTEDRAGNPNCAAAFTANGALIPITVTEENSLVTADAFSVSIWFQMANEDAGNLETFFQKGTTLNDGFSIGAYDLNTPLCFSENPPFSIWDNDWNQEVDVTWTNTDWHHLVITKTSNYYVQLWRDGILRNSQEGLDIGLEALTTYNLGNNLIGNLDDLRVYKRVLNPNEINALYELEADCFTCL